MKTKKLEPFDVSGKDWSSQKDEHGCINPFRQDAFNMGTHLGRNLIAMHANFPDGECLSFTLVNTRTGKRLLIDVEAKCDECGTVGFCIRFGLKNICKKCHKKHRPG